MLPNAISDGLVGQTDAPGQIEVPQVWEAFRHFYDGVVQQVLATTQVQELQFVIVCCLCECSESYILNRGVGVQIEIPQLGEAGACNGFQALLRDLGQPGQIQVVYTFASIDQLADGSITEVLASTVIDELQVRTILRELLGTEIVDTTVPVEFYSLQVLPAVLCKHLEHGLVRDFAAAVQIDFFDACLEALLESLALECHLEMHVINLRKLEIEQLCA